MKSPQEFIWIENILPDGFLRKSMFGGFAYYWNGWLKVVTFEKPGEKEHLGKKYPYEVWYGILFPMERDHHPKALASFPQLVQHPVLPKWLYLPAETEGFESIAEDILRETKRPQNFWGIIPAPKKSKKKKLAPAKARVKNQIQKKKSKKKSS